MNRKIMTKSIAAILAFILTFANVILLGIYTQESIAAGVNLEGQSTNVQNASIEFDAYFQEEGEKKHSKVIDVTKDDEKIYLSIKVTDGYLSNATVELNNSNFSIAVGEYDLEKVQSVEANKVTLNQINKGESVVLELPILVNDAGSDFDVQNFVQNLDRASNVVLSGTYVNNSGTEVNISKTIEVNAKLTATASTSVSLEALTYVPYEIESEKGVVLQYLIKSSVNDDILPIMQTQFEIEIPKINNIEADRISLAAKSTKATNGGAEKIFKLNEDYTYQDGKVLLTLRNNPDENGKASWVKGAKDEIILTLNYGETAYENAVFPEIDVKNHVSLYSNETLVLNAESHIEEQDLESTIGQIVSYSVDTDKYELSKGYMLVEGANNTPYVENMITVIGNKDLVDNVILNSEEKYADENSNTYDANILYTYTKISEENFMQMFGENGYINIYNENDEIISTLNKDNLQYNYQTETTYIKLETSKPISEGILNIENGREIKPAEYSQAQTKMFNKITEKLQGKVNYQDNEKFIGMVSCEIMLFDPQTSIETTISNNSLSTVGTNEAVELRVVLDTSDDTKVLYKNPKITIEFPSYITKLSNINVPEPLYGQGLTLGEHQAKTNENGDIVIEVSLNGEQTAFNTSSVSNGTVVEVYADIDVNELAPAIQDSIKVTVTNENTLSSETQYDIQISYAAEKKVLTRNTVMGYNEQNTKVSSMNQKKSAVIAPDAVGRYAAVEFDVVNSTGNEITDVKVLGRIPFAGNRSVISNIDLGSTFGANMSSSIIKPNGSVVDNATIYYSRNENATQDLDNEENGWTTSSSDIAEVRSYLIVFNDAMQNTERASFKYGILIPENIGENLSTFGAFAVLYKEGDVSKSEESAIIGLTTRTSTTPAVNPGSVVSEVSNDELEAKITMSSSGKALNAGDTVKEGQYVDYTVTIRNKTSNKDLTLDLEVAKENGKFYASKIYDYATMDYEYIEEHGTAQALTRYEELEDETLSNPVVVEHGKIYTYNYTLVVNKDTKGNNLTSTVSLKENDVKVVDDMFASNPITEGLVKVNLLYNKPNETRAYSHGDLTARIEVTNISDRDLSNVKVEIELPQPLKYLQNDFYENGSEYDSVEVVGNKVIFTINTLEKDKTNKIYMAMETGSINLNTESQDIELCAKATVNGEEYTSNVLDKTIYQGETLIEARMTGSVEGEYVEDGQELIYTINIANRGIKDEHSLRISDILPKALVTDSYTVIDEDGNEETVNTHYNSLSMEGYSLKAGSNMTVRIKTTVYVDLAESNTIENKAELNGAYISNVQTNTVIYKIRTDTPIDPDNPDDPSNPDNPDNPENPEKTFSISGIVWKDENKDGSRDAQEEVFSGVTVMLMNNQKSEFIKDERGNVISATTAQDGSYKFEELKKGEYVVVFIYNTDIYEVTTYQKSGVSGVQNSDAIDDTIKINGTNIKIAKSDLITLDSENKENVDLGLVKSKIFDLRLDKTVNTVIVQNKQGTKSYTFEDNKFGKVEIPAKYMAGTTLTIEYKIKVTNEGNVAGRVLKIKDYMPKELEFSSEINNEWYKGTDGNLYTSEFENTVIEPGETKEVTLVLTKVIKEEAAETINNYAEIQETYNVLGLEDEDSVPGNNAQNEDDLSSADLVVTIKTGVLTYTMIAIAAIMIIGILGIGIYLIKKKVLV